MEPQPAKAALAMRRVSNRAIARRLGVSDSWVSRILNGIAPAPAAFRSSLAAMLELPEEELFRARSEVTR